MNSVYCVKERKPTPTVKGSGRIVMATYGRRLLKVKNASCGITKTRFVKQSGKGLLFGKNSPFSNIPILGVIL